MVTNGAARESEDCEPEPTYQEEVLATIDIPETPSCQDECADCASGIVSNESLESSPGGTDE